MPSKRNAEGYLLIDHTESPGLPEELGFDPRIYGKGKKFEGKTYQCKHCQRGVVINPFRVRERAYCPKCDHIICDGCEKMRVASGGECVPFNKKIDDEAERVIRQKIRELVI